MIVLKKNVEYKSVYNCRNSVSDYNLVIFIKKNIYGYNRYGFTSAKKIKKAITRNKLRRRLKEIVRQNEGKLRKSYDIVLMARVNAAESDYKALQKSFYRLINRKNLFKGDIN